MYGKAWLAKYCSSICRYIYFSKLPHPADEEVDYQLVDFYEETKVKFADLSEYMLWEYINSGEPM